VDIAGLARKHATIMNVDIVGYSQMMAHDTLGTVLGWFQCMNRIGDLVHEHAGCVLDTVGDNLSAEFDNETAALYCAMKVQRMLREERIRVRIGLHSGDVWCTRDRRFGEVVNIAARLQSAASPGGIMISEDLAERVEASIRRSLVEHGPQTFKNLPYTVHTLSVCTDQPHDLR